MVLHSFNPSTRKQRQVDFCVFKANLVYTVRTHYIDLYNENSCLHRKERAII